MVPTRLRSSHQLFNEAPEVAITTCINKRRLSIAGEWEKVHRWGAFLVKNWYLPRVQGT